MSFLSRIVRVCLIIGASGCAFLFAEDAHKSDKAAGGEFREITPDQEKAVEKALAWLAKQQTRDGFWFSNGAQGSYPAAMTGLAATAFLAAGHTPGRGPYGALLNKTVAWTLKSRQRDGLLTHGSEGQTMYGHGFLMTFLAEAYGQNASEETDGNIRSALTAAAKLTGQAQSSWGGWYYSPNSGADEGSVTVTQVQALRAGQNVGIPLPPKVMDKAIDYIKKSQNADGGVRYSAGSQGGSSTALTAAGAECLLMGGRYKDPATQKAVDYLRKNINPRHGAGHTDAYTNFYAAQAMFQIGGEDWERFFAPLREHLLRTQTADGSWAGDNIGPVYSTSLAVIILCLPYRYLPITQK
jgi:hypothetical protein